jgi:hypothetical protein
MAIFLAVFSLLAGSTKVICKESMAFSCVNYVLQGKNWGGLCRELCTAGSIIPQYTTTAMVGIVQHDLDS